MNQQRISERVAAMVPGTISRFSQEGEIEDFDLVWGFLQLPSGQLLPTLSLLITAKHPLLGQLPLMTMRPIGDWSRLNQTEMDAIIVDMMTNLRATRNEIVNGRN